MASPSDSEHTHVTRRNILVVGPPCEEDVRFLLDHLRKAWPDAVVGDEQGEFNGQLYPDGLPRQLFVFRDRYAFASCKHTSAMIHLIFGEDRFVAFVDDMFSVGGRVASQALLALSVDRDNRCPAKGGGSDR